MNAFQRHWTLLHQRAAAIRNLSAGHAPGQISPEGKQLVNDVLDNLDRAHSDAELDRLGMMLDRACDSICPVRIVTLHGLYPAA